MYTAILVPLDGSTFGEAALPSAVALARKSGAELHLTHVRSEWPLLWGEAAAGTIDQLSPGWTGEEEYLRRIAERIGEELGRRPRAALLDPPVVDALASYIAAHEIDLVVMSTHGRGGLSRAWLGSVALELLRAGPVPVLLVRPSDEEQAAVAGDRILIPLDGSARSEAILPHATMLGGVLGARFTLVHVLQPAYVMSVYGRGTEREDVIAMSTLRERASAYLKELARRMRDEGAAVETLLLINPNPAEALVAQARAMGSPIVAMSTHGYGTLGRLAFGSVADKVVRAGDMPVLAYRTVESDGADVSLESEIAREAGRATAARPTQPAGS